MIQCVECGEYFPPDCMCMDIDDRLVCQWCARLIRDTARDESQFVCEWCGARGTKIANEYECTIIVKCTKCHHEWMASAPLEPASRATENSNDEAGQRIHPKRNTVSI